MHPGAATNVRRTHVSIALLLGACASSSGEPARLSAEQLVRCRTAEAAYRADAADWPAQRDALAADPVAAAWLVRMFVIDVIAGREAHGVEEGAQAVVAEPRQPADKKAAAALQELRAADEQAAGSRLLRSVAEHAAPPGGSPTTIEQRAIAGIVALGSAAVPVLVHDLLEHEQPQPRELGSELLATIGAPARPALQRVARNGQARQQRAAARALGRIGVDAETLATLRTLAGDGDYTVRADALRSLRSGGEPARALLIQKLNADPDPFVRRVAAQTLEAFPSAPVANALIDYLERCKRERDWPGEQAAQASLQRLAGTRGPRTPDAWRAFAASIDAAPEARPDGGR